MPSAMRSASSARMSPTTFGRWSDSSTGRCPASSWRVLIILRPPPHSLRIPADAPLAGTQVPVVVPLGIHHKDVPPEAPKGAVPVDPDLQIEAPDPKGAAVAAPVARAAVHRGAAPSDPVDSADGAPGR